MLSGEQLLNLVQVSNNKWSDVPNSRLSQRALYRNRVWYLNRSRFLLQPRIWYLDAGWNIWKCCRYAYQNFIITFNSSNQSIDSNQLIIHGWLRCLLRDRSLNLLNWVLSVNFSICHLKYKHFTNLANCRFRTSNLRFRWNFVIQHRYLH